MAAAQLPADHGTSNSADSSVAVSGTASAGSLERRSIENSRLQHLESQPVHNDIDASAAPLSQDTHPAKRGPASYDPMCPVPERTPAPCRHDQPEPSPQLPATQMTSSQARRLKQLSSASTASTGSEYPSASDFVALLHSPAQQHQSDPLPGRSSQQLYFAVQSSKQDKSSAVQRSGGEPDPRNDMTAQGLFDAAGLPGRPSASGAEEAANRRLDNSAPVPARKQLGAAQISREAYSPASDSDADFSIELDSSSQQQASGRRDSDSKSDGSADTALTGEEGDDSVEEKISALFVPHQSLGEDVAVPPRSGASSSGVAAASTASAREVPREVFSSWRDSSIVSEPEIALQAPPPSADMSPDFNSKIRRQMSHSDQQYAASIASLPTTPTEEPEPTVPDSVSGTSNPPPRAMTHYFDEPDQEVETAPIQPRDAIELIPYKHQVGGHTTLWRFSKRAVCKQLTNRENEFYEKVERYHRDLLPFLPRYVDRS